MWKWLKIFSRKKSLMENKEDIVDASAENTSTQVTAKRRKHKLEIRILEADYTDVPDNAPPKWRPINMGKDSGKPIVVEVADKKELAELRQRYAMCDQKMEIIREIDPFDDPPQPKTIPANNQAIPIQAKNNTSGQQYLASQQISTQQVQIAAPTQQITKSKPKIVTIGDLQVKYDGDKVYQKQWVKLSSAEAANFRIVNDSSNKIINLSGKHIECRKWVMIEEDNADDAAEIACGED